MAYYSPLRYPGGKGKLYNYIASIINKNYITKYIEPYAGGAAIAIALLINRNVKIVHINDLDKGIYAFWLTVTKNTDYFLKKLTDTNISIEEWYKQKQIYQNPQDFSID